MNVHATLIYGITASGDGPVNYNGHEYTPAEFNAKCTDYTIVVVKHYEYWPDFVGTSFVLGREGYAIGEFKEADFTRHLLGTHYYGDGTVLMDWVYTLTLTGTEALERWLQAAAQGNQSIYNDLKSRISYTSKRVQFSTEAQVATMQAAAPGDIATFSPARSRGNVTHFYKLTNFKWTDHLGKIHNEGEVYCAVSSINGKNRVLIFKNSLILMQTYEAWDFDDTQYNKTQLMAGVVSTYDESMPAGHSIVVIFDSAVPLTQLPASALAPPISAQVPGLTPLATGFLVSLAAGITGGLILYGITRSGK